MFGKATNCHAPCEPKELSILSSNNQSQVEAKLASVAKELAAWRTLSESTDYEEYHRTTALKNQSECTNSCLIC